MNITAVSPSYLKLNSIGNPTKCNQVHNSTYKLMSWLKYQKEKIEAKNAKTRFILLNNILPYVPI